MNFRFQLNQTTGSKSDGNRRKWTKTKWNFDYGSNDSVLSPEFKNHLGFEIRWKFNFCPLLAKPRKLLKKWKWKHSGIQLRAEIHLKIEILKSWRSKMTLKSDLWFWILNFELDFELEILKIQESYLKSCSGNCLILETLSWISYGVNTNRGQLG